MTVVGRDATKCNKTKKTREATNSARENVIGTKPDVSWPVTRTGRRRRLQQPPAVVGLGWPHCPRQRNGCSTAAWVGPAHTQTASKTTVEHVGRTMN